jgi:hypothetical protein
VVRAQQPQAIDQGREARRRRLLDNQATPADTKPAVPWQLSLWPPASMSTQAAEGGPMP